MQSIVVLPLVFALVSGANLVRKMTHSFDGRIVGGYDIDIRIAPFQVSVRKFDQHICGGSIIAKDKILTAAHCTFGSSPEHLNVRVGSSIHSDGESFAVRVVSQHPKYDPFTVSNDVSVVYVSKSLTFGSNVRPIKLATARRGPSTYLLVTGWGTVKESDTCMSMKLQAAWVPIVSQEDCRTAYSYKTINSAMLCAGYTNGGRDACQGDSGGPLVDIWTGEQVGVVSWGYGCARPGKPGVYASVRDLKEFIQAA